MNASRCELGSDLSPSTSKGYGNTHECSTDDDHDDGRCKWPKSGVTCKKKAANK